MNPLSDTLLIGARAFYPDIPYNPAHGHSFDVPLTLDEARDLVKAGPGSSLERDLWIKHRPSFLKDREPERLEIAEAARKVLEALDSWRQDLEVARRGPREPGVPVHPESHPPLAPCVVALDETHHYEIQDDDKPHIAAILGVYVFDARSVTFCCELTPSFWLVHLYDQVRLTPEAEDVLTDDQRDDIYQRYEQEGGEDCYVHCYDIESIAERFPNRGAFRFIRLPDEVLEEDITPDEVIESLREELCANCVI